MVPVRLRITIEDRGALKAYRNLYGITRVRERLYRSMAAGLREVRIRTEALLRTEPGSPSYPLRWRSEKQRRAVMAYLRKQGLLDRGAEIGYVRTHKTSQGWKVILERGKKPGEISNLIVENRHRARNAAGQYVYVFQYVYGQFENVTFQQPFHADTGWYQLPTVIQDARDASLRAVRRTIIRGERQAAQRKGR